MIDLNTPGAAGQLAARIQLDIDAFAVKEFDDGHRTHLGASMIGEDCARKLAMAFRWMKREEFSGRMLRLFQRGHREEAFFIKLLTGIGFRIEEIDPATGEQFRVMWAEGHAGGSCDGKAWAPEHYGLPFPLLVEFKTKGTGGGFNQLVEKGCAVAAPVHYAQMNVYGKLLGLTHCLYMVINKNDDALHIEIVKLNPAYGDEMMNKGTEIILAKKLPERISENSSFHSCKFCFARELCHEEGKADKNCRSCVRSQPRMNKRWFCTYHNELIPDDFIKDGCEHWTQFE